MKFGVWLEYDSRMNTDQYSNLVIIPDRDLISIQIMNPDQFAVTQNLMDVFL